MRAVDLIQKKRDGQALIREEIRFLIENSEKIPDYQMAAFCMAVYFQDMSASEIFHLTEAMAESGQHLELASIEGFMADKHSTGGVGDKVSLVLVPLVAAAGLYFPKLSGRGLGHTGGTIDKLESIPGFRADLSLKEFEGLVKRDGLAIIESGEELAPVDHRLYALRDVTATVESIPLIVGSILSKKLSIGSHGIVFDVKFGSGALMQRVPQATRLARLLVAITQRAGRKSAALLTDMSQPLGYAVGNALELHEAIKALQGCGPADLCELCLSLGAELLIMAGKARTRTEGQSLLSQRLKSGAALEKFLVMVRNQSGDVRVVEDSSRLPHARERLAIPTPRTGTVRELNARAIGEAAHLLGAGRSAQGEPIDHAVGVELLKKIGDEVERGEPLAYLHINSRDNLESALRKVGAAYRIGRSPVKPRPLVRDRIA